MNINGPHLLTTALLFLVAFLLGAVLGLVARRLVDRLTRRKPVVAVVQPAPVAAPVVSAPEPAPEPTPLAPAIADAVPELLDPVVAIDRHVKAPMRPVFAIPDLPPLVPAAPVEQPNLAPARRAGETAGGRALWSPYQPVEPPAPPARARANGVSATIIPFPRGEDDRPTAALVEELEQLMSTPVPVPVAQAEPAAPAAVAEPVLVAEALPEMAAAPEPVVEPDEIEASDPEPMAIEIAAEAEPSLPEVPAPVVMTGTPLGLEAQMASALGAELLPPGSDPVVVAEEPPEPVVADAQADALAVADDVEAETADEPAPLPVAEFVPDVAPEPEPVAPVADEAELLAEPMLADDEIVADDDPSLDLDTRIEPDIVEPLPEAELAAAPNSVPLPVPEPVVDPAEAPLPELQDWDEVDAEADEAAAMRAIEGNWSPRRTAAMAAKPVDLPEGVEGAEQQLSAVDALAASAAAVAAARRTARAVLDDFGSQSARPPALPGPRDGRADDLTQIIGVLPVVESALNRLGVYHYDQIAAWGADTVNWVETYLGLEGRIGREHWRLQAHELAEAKPPRPSSGGQEVARAGE
jgi:predicted flap endonuclease-1-like 5' DNA nuclease